MMVAISCRAFRARALPLIAKRRRWSSLIRIPWNQISYPLTPHPHPRQRPSPWNQISYPSCLRSARSAPARPAEPRSTRPAGDKTAASRSRPSPRSRGSVLPVDVTRVRLLPRRTHKVGIPRAVGKQMPTVEQGGGTAANCLVSQPLMRLSQPRQGVRCIEVGPKLAPPRSRAPNHTLTLSRHPR